jgi:Transglutaminase-like superfamily
MRTRIASGSTWRSSCRSSFGGVFWLSARMASRQVEADVGRLPALSRIAELRPAELGAGVQIALAACLLPVAVRVASLPRLVALARYARRRGLPWGSRGCRELSLERIIDACARVVQGDRGCLAASLMRMASVGDPAARELVVGVRLESGRRLDGHAWVTPRDALPSEGPSGYEVLARL